MCVKIIYTVNIHKLKLKLYDNFKFNSLCYILHKLLDFRPVIIFSVILIFYTRFSYQFLVVLLFAPFCKFFCLSQVKRHLNNVSDDS